MARITMKGAYDNGANDAFPPRNSERQITAAAVTQGAVDFVYGASLRVFLIPNEGAITKVSGDYKDNLALNTKWMLSPFALGALTVRSCMLPLNLPYTNCPELARSLRHRHRMHHNAAPDLVW